jgi:hypothetical protein
LSLKTRRTVKIIYIEFSPAEARVLLDELSDVRGGARLPKLKQVCRELEMALVIEAQRERNAAK